MIAVKSASVSLSRPEPHLHTVEVSLRQRRQAYDTITTAVSGKANTHHIDMVAFSTMPRYSEGLLHFLFFQLPDNFFDSDSNLLDISLIVSEYERLSLVPDPVGQAIINQENPDFTVNNPNFAIWPVPYRESKYGFLSFDGKKTSLGQYLRSEKSPIKKGFWFGGVTDFDSCIFKKSA